MSDRVLSRHQFFHGSPDDYPIGHVIDPSQPHERAWDVSSPTHVHFTPSYDDAADWGVQAARRTGRKRTNVYGIKTLGEIEPDPLDPYGSWRSSHPVQITSKNLAPEDAGDLGDAIDSYWKNR